ncbi:MAG: hypothetical protein NTW02_09920, partial [Cyanobium sp. LacPavin_0920_WC12_MAG_62_9]|nr:hypothetical protein [Cyanobium sp. LacPavin_0920_WC12_MAG_62_9]
MASRSLPPSRSRGNGPAITGTLSIACSGSGANSLGSDSSGASCVITTDSEGSRLARQSSHVQSIELRTYVFL